MFTILVVKVCAQEIARIIIHNGIYPYHVAPIFVFA